MIDPIINNLVNLGVAGCMAAVVVWHVWHTQTKTLPAILLSFEKQMEKERTACNERLTQQQTITQIRHEENIAQSTLMINSLRETHHSIANLANQTALHHAKIDVVLGMRKEVEGEQAKGA